MKTDGLPTVGAYSKATADALKGYTFDRKALGARGLGYEKLDQLTHRGAARVRAPVSGMARYFLGIDVSTTGAKALLIDEKGAVAASATTPLTLQTPKPLWSEQDPHEWWTGTAASIRKALADAGATGGDVAAVGLTGQMHGLVLLDATARGPAPGHPLERPADRRRVRRDREAGRAARAHPRGRQRRPHRLHRPQDPLGPQPRARGLREGEARPAAEGLRPPPAHRRGGDGQGRRRRARSSSTSRPAPGRSSSSRSSTSRPSGCPRPSRGPRSTGTVTAEAAAETGLARRHAGRWPAAATRRRAPWARARSGPASSR